VGLAGDASQLAHAISSFGHVVAPRVITACDLTLTGIPAYALWGSPVELHLALSADHADQSSGELEVSLGRLIDMSPSRGYLFRGVMHLQTLLRYGGLA